MNCQPHRGGNCASVEGRARTHRQLSHSRALFLRAPLLQTHEMLTNAQHHAFVAWDDIPRRGIDDTMKTAVDRVRHGMVREINARFSAMVSHDLFDLKTIPLRGIVSPHYTTNT